MNMELDDLPPRYRAQAEQQLAARKRRAADPLAEAVKQAKAVGRDFDSRGEYEFYTGVLGADRPPGGVEIYRDHHRRGQRRPETLARAGKGGLNP